MVGDIRASFSAVNCLDIWWLPAQGLRVALVLVGLLLLHRQYHVSTSNANMAYGAPLCQAFGHVLSLVFVHLEARWESER